MLLRLVRLMASSQVTGAVERLFEMLAQIFYSKRYTLENIKSWIFAAFKLIIYIHVFACFWLLEYTLKKRNNDPHLVPFSDQDSRFVQYVESWYLMTTTISTVGYGDYKAFINYEPWWTNEMLFLTFVIIIGLILFSLVTNEIFSYKQMETLQSMLTKESRIMEVFMYDISLRRKDKYLEREKIDECINSLTNQVKDSTLMYFENNRFYQELPQNLKYGLVKHVLTKHMSLLTFFFEDFNSRKRASDAFIIKVLTRLKCQLYRHGDVII